MRTQERFDSGLQLRITGAVLLQDPGPFDRVCRLNRC